MSADAAPTVTLLASATRAESYLSAIHARWLTNEPERRWRELDGSLLFADVSGFTQLGERLARTGRIGSEELTDVVNAAFGGMLVPVRELGGDMLKFGGDAMLVLFEGDGHAERASAAALHMRGAIRSLRRMSTSAGAVSLRLSAGVASGRVQLFLAGTTFRELIVAGPLASQVVALESAALTGEVLVGAGTAAALNPAHLNERRGPGTLLHSPPPVSAPGPPELPGDVDLSSALPDHLRDHEPGDGEHRTVTIGFVQHRGLDELLRDLGAEAVADLLDGLVGVAQDECRARGVTFVGTDVDNDAGKIILMAGAPSASPDDEDRVLHVLRAIVARPWPIEVRAGVNRGRAFVVDVGPPARRTYTVMGDATNLAARVMGRAAAGTVLATRAVLDHARDDFARSPVEPFLVKGKSQPVHADVVGEARGGRRAAPRAGAPLIGRDQELAVLLAALEEARAGMARAVELVGEPGIGKSRLVEAVVAAADGFLVSEIAAGPYGAFSPYLVVRGPLRALIGCSPEADDETVEQTLRRTAAAVDPGLLRWLPLIAIPFGLDLAPTPETAGLGPEFSRARMHAAVLRLIDGLLGDQPALLVIEDGHWLDDASAELLSELVRGLTAGRMVVLTRRHVASGLRLAGVRDVVTLPIEPLSEWDARQLLREAGIVLSAHDQAELVERAAGNPLFLQELLAAARAGETVEGLPDSVEALITARIDTLPHADRAFLRQASVLGVRVPTDLLEEMLGCGPFVARATLRRLDDFLVPEAPGRVRFRHALLRDAAYETLPFRRRRELHARAAEILERSTGGAAKEDAELLAFHYHAAGRWPEAWEHARVAGEHAIRSGAPVEAARFLRLAIDAARRVPDLTSAAHATVAEQLGDAEMLAGRHDEAAAAYRVARRSVAGDKLAEADLCRKAGLVAERHRHYTQALRWYSRALSMIEFEDHSNELESLRARIYCLYGSCRLRQGRLRDCLPLLERAAEGAKHAGDRATLAHAYYLLDWAHTDLGTPDAHHFRDLALPIFEEIGDYGGQAKCLNNLGIDAFYEGRWDEAVGSYERGLQMNLRWGDVVQAAVLQNNIGEIRMNQGRLDEAETLLLEALNTFGAADFQLGIGSALTHLTAVATRNGDAALAARRSAAARAALEGIGADAMVLELDVRDAERLLYARDSEAALEASDRAREAVLRQGGSPLLVPAFQRIAAVAKAQLGDIDGARGRLHEAIDLAAQSAAVFEEALARETLARLGGAGAAANADRAADVHQSLSVVSSAVVPLS